MNVGRLVLLLFLTTHLLVTFQPLAAVGAWVLWVQDEHFWDPKGNDWGRQTSSWHVLDAASSETDCRRKVGERIKRVTNPDNPSKDEDVLYKIIGESTVNFVFFPKDSKSTDKTMTRSQVLRYICLPDTVDPRERSKR